MVDPDRVRRRLRHLDDRLSLLVPLLTLGRDRYRADVAVRTQVERHLQLAIQAAIDVAVHIAAQDTSRTPEEYGQAFELLVAPGVLDSGLATRLRGAAGLRNILVHDYLELDPAKVWEAAQELEHLRTFARAVLAYLARDPEAG